MPTTPRTVEAIAAALDDELDRLTEWTRLRNTWEELGRINEVNRLAEKCDVELENIAGTAHDLLCALRAEGRIP